MCANPRNLGSDCCILGWCHEETPSLVTAPSHRVLVTPMSFDTGVRCPVNPRKRCSTARGTHLGNPWPDIDHGVLKFKSPRSVLSPDGIAAANECAASPREKKDLPASKFCLVERFSLDPKALMAGAIAHDDLDICPLEERRRDRVRD